MQTKLRNVGKSKFLTVVVLPVAFGAGMAEIPTGGNG